MILLSSSTGDPCRRAESGGMYQLRNSRFSSEWTFIGFLCCVGESLCVVSGELSYVEKVSERAKGFPNQQGHDSLLSGQPFARTSGEEAG